MGCVRSRSMRSRVVVSVTFRSQEAVPEFHTLGTHLRSIPHQPLADTQPRELCQILFMELRRLVVGIIDVLDPQECRAPVLHPAGW